MAGNNTEWGAWPGFGEPFLHVQPVFPREALARPDHRPLVHLGEPHERPSRRGVVHLFPGGRPFQRNAFEVFRLDLDPDAFTNQTGDGEGPTVLEDLIWIGYQGA